MFGVLTLVACSAANGAGSGTNPGSGGNGSGAGPGTGAGNSSAGGGANTNLNVTDDGGPDSSDVMNGVCSNQSFDLQRKPAEILIVLDRSASMQDPPDGSASGTGSKWSLVVPGVSEVVTSTDSAVSWGLQSVPRG